MSLPSIYAYFTSIIFLVMVPVLSTQSTVAEPKVSTAAILLINVFFFANLKAPKDRKTVKTTGNSSGIIAIAKVMPDNILSIKFPLYK